VGAAYELLPHAHTESAFAEAQALGLEPDDVAKTLIVKTLEGYLRAVVPAAARLDERKLRDLTGGSKKDVHLATEDDLRRDYPDFELGAVPPAGGARRDPVIVDTRVTARGVGRARGRLARAVGLDRDFRPRARSRRRGRRHLQGGLVGLVASSTPARK
jgi:prolyl-tRNA editing enzyme YbaK/EbsC (Cys-tRNA(Pro) deacylase)